MAGDKRKIPVTERQFLWVQDDDKGEIILHVGPTMVSPTAADRVVIDDGEGGFTESQTGQPQRMLSLSDSQYAVLFNPLADRSEDEGPNGRFRPGRNESKDILNGTRHMIPGPCSFYLHPGQRVEVRDAHELASNQYLVVKVYGSVDVSAPYFEITKKSATIKRATAEDITKSTSEGLDEIPDEPIQLTRGQLIVIRGLDTQFYIPPTGVDVVPDLSVDGQGTQLTSEAARNLLRKSPAAPEAEPSSPPMMKGKKGRVSRGGVDQSARYRQTVQQRGDEPSPEGFEESLKQQLSNDFYRQALEREVRKSRLVRQAVVLGEKEFCVILDADGKREIKAGPARVFPGPYDSFAAEGADNRLYYAYELLPQRALWLRFIARISREELLRRLPRGVEVEEKDYEPGDEMILTGVNSFFFPFNEIEILHPLTGQPHVGNEHESVFIEAIGIDQKSGIYVRDLSTGEVRLVRGKRSYLVDPRKEVQITRVVPPEEWNLWVAQNEPHKRTQAPVTTPWALSLLVPHNTAVLAASAVGQRVIEGPCVALLDYDEKLVPMNLSTGTPKNDERMLKTCYLRTVGNRVSDVVRVESSDFVQIDVQVSYQVSFSQEHRDIWFNQENYVGALSDHLRSLVRSQCRRLTLTELWSDIPAVIRDIILGEKKEEGRTGRLFEENGMRISEVEVLKSKILDEEIGLLFSKVQRESVALQIGDRQAKEQLRSENLRHQLALERMEMKQSAREQRARIETVIRGLEHSASLGSLKNREFLERESIQLEGQRKLDQLNAEIERRKLRHETELSRLQQETAVQVEGERLVHEEELDNQKALHQLEIEKTETESKASVAEREAIQPALIEALTALGDKIMLGEVAQNMNLVSLFQGKDVATIFSDLLGGTKLGQTISGMLPEE